MGRRANPDFPETYLTGVANAADQAMRHELAKDRRRRLAAEGKDTFGVVDHIAITGRSL
jgi:hypothetical protein